MVLVDIQREVENRDINKEQETNTGVQNCNDWDRLWHDFGPTWCSEELKQCDLIFTRLNVVCMVCQIESLKRDVAALKANRVM